MKITVSFLALSILFFLPAGAHAALGARADSIDADQQRLSGAKRKLILRSGYTVHEITNDGIRLREYVSSTGTVFAIAWQGIMHPDLTDLLGTYFQEYRASSESLPKLKGRHPLAEIRSANVVVQKSGHMRSVQGKAFAPALFPEGVTEHDIQ